jgi:hypothetical protein
MMHYFYHLDYPYVEMPGASKPNLSGQSARPVAHFANAKRPLKKTNMFNALDEKPPAKEPNLVLHTKVYALADKYLIDGLKAVALEKFREDVKTSWSTEEFLKAIEVAYTSTLDRTVGMRHVIVSTICDNEHWLLNRDSVKQCLRDTPDLAYDVLMHRHQNPSLFT